MNSRILCLAAIAWLLAPIAAAEPYRPADQGARPESGTVTILPEKFLRGFDPVTVYFPGNVGSGAGPADDGARLLRIEPAWPGGWFWLDRKTLQFRPAEPWPALARFQVRAQEASRILATMMSAPSAMSPAPDSSDLKPFRTFTLTFPQALSLGSLKKMLSLEIRELPGLADSPRQAVHEFTIAQLPRQSHREAAVYAVTLEHDIPEGTQLHVDVSLALGEEGKVLWNGRLSTRLPFHLAAVECGGSQLSLRGSASSPKELALACGNTGETPQLVFSAPVANLTLTELKKLLHLDPAVENLRFEVYGSRVTLKGKFTPDVLYRLSLSAAQIQDDSGRKLVDPGKVEAFIYLGWKQPFLKFKQASAVLEAKGPRMLPLIGYAEPRADVRIYRIDPLHTGLWPFPRQPVVVNEEASPPFPGEEPERKSSDTENVQPDELVRHLRLLGSPLVSKVIDLPLADKGSTTRFGLEIGRLLDEVVGSKRPGHYLVGLRRLAGPPQRLYMRVQITNLSLTAVEERDQVIFYARTLDQAEPVQGAKLVIEVVRDPPERKPGEDQKPPRLDILTLTTDADGRAVMKPQQPWREVRRVYLQKGEDTLVLEPGDPPPVFASNHWSMWGQWLYWLSQPIPAPVNDKLLGFVFTERPIYRPEEKVYLKGFVRRKLSGVLTDPGSEKNFGLKIKGPGGQEWQLPVSFTPLYGFSAEFQEKDTPTGMFSAVLFQRQPYQEVARRPFKVEAYRIPTFEVQLIARDKVRNDGPFQVKAVAKYYAGGSVAGQPIHWTVTRQPYHHVPAGREGYLFASSTQFSREGASRPPETVTEENTLDDNGSNEISVNPGLDLDGSARVYHFDATVTGVDNQQVNATTEVLALPPFVLGMKLLRYSEKPITLKPEILALGVDDKPVEGQEVTVRLFSRTWHSHLRETDFATGKASYVTEQQDNKLLEKVITSGKNPVVPELPITRAGVYVVELFARDKLGRVQALSADLYVGGKEPIAWKKPQQGVFTLSTDKKEYVPGDTARVIIQSPFQEAKALVIVEEPAGNRYHWLQVAGGKAVHEIAVQPSFVPNLPVHVVLMRGRLGEGSEGDERYRPQTLAASVAVEVKPVANKVNVELKHPAMARPGSTIDIVIGLKDEAGRPLPGEVTLWLVDEAVLSLAAEGPLDPLTAFIVRNLPGVAIRDTRNLVVGKLQQEEEDPGADGGEGEEGGAKKRVVRKNFQTVPYYQATLEVGPSGTIKVPVKLSDDLTNFKVRVVAVSGKQRFGFKQDRLRVRLPVLVQPQLPRFVRQGDRFWGGGVGRLVEGAEGAGSVSLQIGGALRAQSFQKPITLQRNRAESHLFQVQVPAGGGGEAAEVIVRMDITRKADGVGDAFELKLPLLPDRVVEHLASFERWKSGEVALKPFPEKPRAQTATQEVLISSVPGVLELVSGLDYLAAYPHGCLEQKLSQLMPQLATGEILKRLGLNDAYYRQVMAQVRRLLTEITPFQDDKGFFGYWPGSPGDIALTAQAVDFLHMARKAGAAVDEAQLQRAIDALKKVLRSDYLGFLADFRYNQQAAAIRSLTLAGAMDEHYLIDLYQHRNEMDLVSIADLAAAMNLKPDLFKTNLVALKDHLWNNVVLKLYQGKPVFEGLKWWRPNWGYGYLGSNVSTLAAVTESLFMLDPENPRLTLLRDGLISMASASGFGSTHDNRRAIAALAVYLERARQENIGARVTVPGGGELKLDATTKVARTEVKSTEPLKIKVTADAELGARVRYTYLPEAPGDQVAAQGQGFLVSRRATVLPASGTPATHFEDTRGATQKVAVGDILEFAVSLTSEEERYHVALVVPFAAGLEPLNPELKTSGPEAQPSEPDSLTASYVQRLDQEVRYYFTHLPTGTHTVCFRVRATCEGAFIHPAPYAEQMYHQDVRGRGAGMRLIVTGEHEH